jgi:hypothetical protein
MKAGGKQISPKLFKKNLISDYSLLSCDASLLGEYGCFRGTYCIFRVEMCRFRNYVRYVGSL